VVDVPASGYSLLGGRVDVIQHRTVAAVIYKHGREVITLFCWPVNKETVSDADRLIDGYRVGTWSNAECNYIVVSKLSKREHDEFLESFRDHLESNIY
jgi:anti-sigma factor RsiW